MSGPTAERLLRDATARLAEAQVASPDFDAAELLAHVLGTTRGALPRGEVVGADAVAAFELLVERRAARVPLQHLTGLAGFRYLELAVGPGVFVPRPETEVLAGWAVEAARAVVGQGRGPVVVDLCTGSGAIALSVATEVPEATVHAVELDASAHAWAERNLSGSGVDLRLGDMADSFPELDGSVDVVVANPPYIPLEAYESVAVEVRDHDPSLALWSGEDGLDAMRTVERVAARLLTGGGQVGAEHADVQGDAAPRLFGEAGRWLDVRDHRDLAGRPRFVTARLGSHSRSGPGRLTG